MPGAKDSGREANAGISHHLLADVNHPRARVMMVLGTFVYDLLGSAGLMGERSPVRHPAERRRLRIGPRKLI